MIEVEGLKKHMGDKLLIENLSFSIPPGGIVGVIGPNGAGKSTLFKMITGQEKPDEGTITLGDTVQLSYVDQSRDDLNPDDNIWEAITGGAEVIQQAIRQDQVAHRGCKLLACHHNVADRLAFDLLAVDIQGDRHRAKILRL